MTKQIVHLVMKDTSDLDPSEEVVYVASTDKAQKFIDKTQAADKRNAPWRDSYSINSWAVDK